MRDVKQHPNPRNPKSQQSSLASRHAVRRHLESPPEYSLERPELDVHPYDARAGINYPRLQAYALRKPTLTSRLAGVLSEPIKKRLRESGIKRRTQDQLECLLRIMLGLCMRSRSYGYFYFSTMLAQLVALEQRRPDGYSKRQLKQSLNLLADIGLIEFQIDALLHGGLYRMAFYDQNNLAKQEWHVANFAKTLKKNLMVSHTCPKMKSHSYRAKALGIKANREEEIARANVERHKQQDKERRRLAEAKRRHQRQAATRVAQKPIAAPSRAALILTHATPPVSITKLVTATMRPQRGKARLRDRSGGVSGHYRDKLMAMGLTRAVQEYDRIQAARNLR